MAHDPEFLSRYRDLMARMESLAKDDGDVFLPNLVPQSQVQYVLVCMEPSLGRWAKTVEDGRRRVEQGYRNFLYSVEDFILHFAAKQYLCSPTEHYHLTDISKGAMLVERAGLQRTQRYERWFRLLEKELELVATPDAPIVAVGKKVQEFLEERVGERPWLPVIHYSGQAAPARNKEVEGHEEEFEKFRGSVSVDDLMPCAKRLLAESPMRPADQAETIARLGRAKELSESRQKLLFAYKTAFEDFRELHKRP